MSKGLVSRDSDILCERGVGGVVKTESEDIASIGRTEFQPIVTTVLESFTIESAHTLTHTHTHTHTDDDVTYDSVSVSNIKQTSPTTTPSECCI